MMGDKFSAGWTAGLGTGDQHYKPPPVQCVEIDCSVQAGWWVIIYGDYNDRTQWSLCQCDIPLCSTDQCFLLF